MSNEIRAKVDQILENAKIGIEWRFVPWSRSRNAKELNPSLNYQATILRNGVPITGLASIDYSMGCVHCPGYRQHWGRPTTQSRAAERVVAWECENGRPGFLKASGIVLPIPGKPAILPSSADLLYCLLLDAGATSYSTFEQWAEDLGLDTDSRKAEAVYRQCLAIGLAILNGIPADVLGLLREALQDY